MVTYGLFVFHFFFFSVFNIVTIQLMDHYLWCYWSTLDEMLELLFSSTFNILLFRNTICTLFFFGQKKVLLEIHNSTFQPHSGTYCHFVSLPVKLTNMRVEFLSLREDHSFFFKKNDGWSFWNESKCTLRGTDLYSNPCVFLSFQNNVHSHPRLCVFRLD